jgi:hypothetical protein
LTEPGSAAGTAFARHQLARVEQLRHVVVRADFQADDLVDVVVTGGQHDHRHAGGLAQLAADGQAVHFRHHDIQDDEVGVDGARLLQRLLAVVRLFDAKTLIAQVQTCQLDDVFFVVDYQDCVGHNSETGRPFSPHDTTPLNHHLGADPPLAVSIGEGA